MKLLVDARLYGQENTGIGRYIQNLIDNLPQIDKKSEFIYLLRENYYNKLKYPENVVKILANTPHYSFREQLLIPRIISKHKPDLVHFPHFNVPIWYRGKFIVTIHDLLMKKPNRGATTLPAPVYAAKRLGLERVIRHAVERSCKIIVPSKSIKDEMLSTYHVNKSKVKVIYEGVSISISNKEDSLVLKKYKISKPYIIYVGNAYPHKNLERAIIAIAKVRSGKLGGKHSQLTFAIIGARSIFTKRLASLVAKYNAYRFVDLLGWVPDSELSVLYRESEGFLYPSLTEGFGLPGFEAMANNSIVIASDIPVFKEIYKNKAIYFNPHNTDSIADAICRLLNMPYAQKHTMREKAYKLAKTFTWVNMAKSTLKLYKQEVNNSIYEKRMQILH